MTDKNDDKKKKNTHQGDDIQADLSYELEDDFVEEESSKNRLAKLRKELKEAKEQGKEYLTGWQKERADFMNYKTAEAERMNQCKNRAIEDMLTQMLPVLDSFDMAFSNRESWEKVDTSWRKGVEFIYSQFLSVLSSYGVDKIEAIGVPFDPSFHDPVEMIPTEDEKEDHMVAELIQTGYRKGNTILRPAKVKVYEFHRKEEE